MMLKLAGIAKTIVNVGKLCEMRNLSEEDLPTSLRAIPYSLQKFVPSATMLPNLHDLTNDHRVERVLTKCSRKKGIKRFLLREDLLTRIKQCDVELSYVLQTFQVRALFFNIRVNRVTSVPAG